MSSSVALYLRNLVTENHHERYQGAHSRVAQCQNNSSRPSICELCTECRTFCYILLLFQIGALQLGLGHRFLPVGSCRSHSSNSFSPCLPALYISQLSHRGIVHMCRLYRQTNKRSNMAAGCNPSDVQDYACNKHILHYTT